MHGTSRSVFRVQVLKFINLVGCVRPRGLTRCRWWNGNVFRLSQPHASSLVPIKHPLSLPSSSPLITHGQLKDALAAYGNPRMKVSRMLAAGELIPLRRGLYLRDRTVNPRALAPALASPTKALCDSIALDAFIRSQKDVRAWLEAMRIEEVPPLDPEQLAACAANYGRPAVRHLARYFQKIQPPP